MNKKTIPPLFFLILVSGLVFSQDNKADEQQVLIGSNIRNISGFGGLLIDFSGINGKLAVSTGGGGAVLLNQLFYFGGYGLGNRSEMSLANPFTGQQPMNLDFNHGGLWLGYIFKPKKLIHMDVSTKFGWGSIRVSDKQGNQQTILDDNIFCFTPQFEGEINIAYWFRINGSVGYRLVEGVHNDLFTPGDFNSPVVGISFLFGWFKDYTFPKF
jgi:hypothetical protein